MDKSQFAISYTGQLRKIGKAASEAMDRFDLIAAEGRKARKQRDSLAALVSARPVWAPACLKGALR